MISTLFGLVFYTLISFIDINMKQSFFIFMVITLMLPQFVSAKRGKNSSQLTVISYNMRYGTAEGNDFLYLVLPVRFKND